MYIFSSYSFLFVRAINMNLLLLTVRDSHWKLSTFVPLLPSPPLPLQFLSIHAYSLFLLPSHAVCT